MKKIIVPTDFSSYSNTALRTAIEISKKTQQEILLLHIIDYVQHINHADSVSSQSINDLHKELKEESKEQLDQQLKSIASEGCKVTAAIQTGFLKDVILEMLDKDPEINLIVMGSKGSSGLHEVLLGSNTEKIIRYATCPVLTVDDFDKKIEFNNIVLAHNFEESLGARFKLILNFVKTLGATLHLVRINTPQNFEGTRFTMKAMDNFIKRWELENVTKNQFDHENLEIGLAQFSHDVKGDMIVMGTHGRKGLGHFLYGSIAEDIANHLDIPVLTFKIKEFKD